MPPIDQSPLLTKSLREEGATRDASGADRTNLLGQPAPRTRITRTTSPHIWRGVHAGLAALPSGAASPPPTPSLAAPMTASLQVCHFVFPSAERRPVLHRGRCLGQRGGERGRGLLAGTAEQGKYNLQSRAQYTLLLQQLQK
ncbi:hypothetical protein SEVIR_8G085466v4 [Setaria viridis]